MYKDYKKDITECIPLHFYNPRNLSENFHSSEFLSKGDDTLKGYIHPVLIELLQLIRDKFGVPIKVNSGYRSPYHNKKEGGSKNSTHMYGLACDITVLKDNNIDHDTLDKIYEFLNDLGVGGLKRYTNFIHLDIWGYRRW